MLDWWDKYRDKALLVAFGVAFVLLVLVKVKLDVPAFMKGPGWKTWIDFFQSDAFEDIAGDTLTGLISGYIFYVLVQWMPRVNAERKAKKLLNSLVSGHVESFQKAEIFGHSRSLAEFDELKIGDIEGNLQTLQGETEVSSLLAISYMSKWSHQMMSDSLQVALMLGIPQAQLWMELTSRVAKIKYLSEEADKGGVLGRQRQAVDTIGAVVIGKEACEADQKWHEEIKSQSTKFFELAKKWEKINS
ncbi:MULTISPECIES: hypothetical protein [Pseudomonas]|uniref:hypothetical protein n=2 Tax=Pseudomonas TaxID=286 RepID=UPI0006D4714E|nr:MULTISPECIES: hypothetical protein [Pseudomonas]MBP2081790.1 hypothetical protein [Pseudomonas sp. PvP089]MBP2086593.1 hypothetical protein [Pseudomonas sp. PvP088]MBP2221246.1 hypothetical protein [Pseudomonas putida]MCZ9636697.1 hypothetical protein [Pseudomonas putida]